MSSEEDELFTEEEDDEYEPASGTFSVHRPLDPPNTKSWSVADLHGWWIHTSQRFLCTEFISAVMHEGFIDLEAPYQRASHVQLFLLDVVWPELKQIKLIDSIFRNYYVPPVIFAVRKDKEGNDLYVCVDGKQRLTSIFKFMDDRDPRTKKSYWFTKSNSQKSRALLPENYKKIFKHKQLTCTVEYAALKPGDERDLFQRVQLGMSLTPAERLRAISSPISDWVHKLQQKFVDTENGLQQNLRWNVARGRDFSGMAQFCFCCWQLPQFTTPTNSKLEKWLQSAPPPKPDFHKQVQKVLESYVHLSMREEYQAGFSGFKERVAPVEFLMIGILLVKMRNCPWPERAAQVSAMRTHTRSKHKDIRGNDQVMKTMWVFIDQISTKGASFEGWDSPAANAVPQKKTAAINPRKRQAEIEEDKPGPSKKPNTIPTVDESCAQPQSTFARAPRISDPTNGVKFVC
ncbi:hypothetical protein Clacol_000642 [Clathrus columnatus]|uniref:GmrSD restriction endonucleases N-terminal domain-containing protein n=1 Tax=Clathrus columnatus TaxID=1419009 RepID=A0AAV4ZXG8_9AGAM|nr:hypothetical protein Clacol_000642 [Clathrus columnatus]